MTKRQQKQQAHQTKMAAVSAISASKAEAWRAAKTAKMAKRKRSATMIPEQYRPGVIAERTSAAPDPRSAAVTWKERQAA